MKKTKSVPFNGTQEQEAMLRAVIDELRNDQGCLMPIMQKAQDIYGYLPYEVQKMISDELDVPMEKIYGVATFYENFSLEPKGRYVIKVCDGTACHVRKSIPILEEFRKELKVSAEAPTTEDMLFTVETVSCLGACGLAPVCTVNDHVHPSMTPEKAKDLIAQLKEEAAHEN